jgi:3-dehydroquinate synthase
MALERPAGNPVTGEDTYGFSVTFSFPVHFTRDLWNPANTLFADAVSRLEPHRRHRVFFVVDDNVARANPDLFPAIDRYVAAHQQVLRLSAAPVVLPGGEPAKNDFLHTLKLLRQMNDAGLDRQSVVAIIGGGAVLDVASFAAAICHRGIRTVRIPTTVLSQDDSGIAVKNSVNVFGKKNFAGTFVPPFAVLNDFDFLQTLEPRDLVAGLSEAIKVALLREPSLFEFIERHAAEIATGAPAVLNPVVQRSAELHLAHICGNGDPFELGSARPLDFGHWAAHKLESMTNFRMRHGEAVSIGIALDLTYATKLGVLDAAVAARIIGVLVALGLPVWDDVMLETGGDGRLALLSGLQEFREHLGGELHITMLRDIGKSYEVTDMDEALIIESLQALQAAASAARDVPAQTCVA